MYVGLWTRLDGFERAALDRALEGEAWFRAADAPNDPPGLARDWSPFAVATREARRMTWQRHPAHAKARSAAAAARKLRG